MTKRRWKRHSGVKDKIFSIVKSNKDITTSGIIVKLKEKDIKVTWKLVNSFLVEFEQDKKITRIQIGQMHKINFWNVTAKVL